MNNLSYKLIYLISFICFLVFVEACKKNKAILDSPPPTPTPDRESLGVDETALPTGEAQTQEYLQTLDVMQLKILNRYDDIYGTPVARSFWLHKAGPGNANEPCQLPKEQLQIPTPGVATPTTILCWLEGEEEDLVFQGLSVQAEFPAGYCEYVTYEPYFYYYRPYGSTNVKFQTYSYGECYSCNYPNDGYQTCNSNSDFVKFLFDYSLNESKYPNCDEGTYQNFSRSFTDPNDPKDGICQEIDAGNTTEIVSTGKGTKCRFGPLVHEKFYDEERNIRRIIMYGIRGLLSPHDWNSRGDKENEAFGGNTLYGHSRYLANYSKGFAQGYLIDTTDKYTYNFDHFLRFAGDRPVSYDPIENAPIGDYFITSPTDLAVTGNILRLRDPFKGAYPFYTWTCLNRAREILGVIHLQVREWNYHFGTDSGIDQTDPLLMDLDGFEDEEGYNAINDFRDWDDKILASPAAVSFDSRTPTNVGFEFPLYDPGF